MIRSLRARILVALVLLTALGLGSLDAATVLSLQSFLVQRTDQQLDSTQEPLRHVVEEHVLGLGRGGPLNQNMLYGLVSPGGYVGVFLPDGTAVLSTTLVPQGERPSSPRLPSPLPALGPGERAAYTEPALQAGGPDYRVHVVGLDGGAWMVSAQSLRDVQGTVAQLSLIAAILSALVLAAVIGLGLWLIRVGLRPLDRIAATADAIAAGDLSLRAPTGDPRTEVGRLAAAFNTMLARIEHAFAEQRASEQRLRRFVADASHELRTPLTSVRGYAELFRRGAASRPEDLAKTMSRIEQEARRMGVLVDDLLLLARLDQGRPLEREPVDLAAVAADAVDAARAVEPERPLSLAAPAPVVVAGDRQRLRQVLDNLLANVRVHTPRGAPARVSIRAAGGEALVEVADSGPGIPPDVGAGVFERFARIDPGRSRDVGGSGLGLSIVSAIAAAHGGSAEVRSEPGQGARFTVRLPLAPGAPAPAPAAEPGAAWTPPALPAPPAPASSRSG